MSKEIKCIKCHKKSKRFYGAYIQDDEGYVYLCEDCLFTLAPQLEHIRVAIVL